MGHLTAYRTVHWRADSEPKPSVSAYAVQIRRADAGDLDVIADLLGEAYHDLAPLRGIVLSSRQRTRVLPAYLRIHVEHALTFGEIHLTADRSAVAVWFPYDGSRPEPASYHTRLALACGQYADQFQTLEAG